MNSVCLIIIFNHRYDKNLPLLEYMYRERFSNRYYLVPFYDGKQENVIPVYGRSIFFEGYIAQGAQIFIKEHFDHYLFVADDMILNPAINETNYKDYFEVEIGQNFIPGLMPLQDIKELWLGTLAAVFYQKKQKYIECEHELPDKAMAMQKFANQGIEIRSLTRKEVFKEFTFDTSQLVYKARLALRIFTRLRHPFKKTIEMPYPLCGSYSDIVLVSKENIKSFAHYCGVFDATTLFAEVAIPSALVLASDKKIQTEKTMKCHGVTYWQGLNVFCKTEEFFMDKLFAKYKNLDDILNNYPEDQLYLHPVKLSKWMKK